MFRLLASSRAALLVFFGLLFASAPLRAQLDPKLQTVGPSFLDLYQQSANLSQKPEVVTVFDFSGSMASAMYHRDYIWPINTDTSDGNSTAGMTFTLRTGNGTNTTASKDKYGTIMATGRFDVIVNLTSGLTLTNGSLVRPDGTLLEYATAGDTAINTNYVNSSPLLGGESSAVGFKAASDVRNWIRCASHVRFKYTPTTGPFSGVARTFDLPLCWTILDDPSVQPNIAAGQFRKMYNTYPLKMTILNPATGIEIEMDTAYRVASQTAGAATGMFSATTGSAPMTACTFANSNNGSGNWVGWKSNYIKWIWNTSTGIIQSTNANGKAFKQSLDPDPNVAGDMIPARTRTQGVKDAAMRTWAKYYNKVFWAYRFLKYFAPDSTSTQTDDATYPNNNSRSNDNAGNPLTTAEFGCGQRSWFLLNNNSDNGLKRLAALLQGGSTTLNSALSNTYAQLNDPNNVFNDIEVGADKPVECRNIYVMLFTDGVPNTDPGTPDNTNTPYVGSEPAPATATMGTAKTGNLFFAANKTRIDPSNATPYYNVINLAALAAHGGDTANGGWVPPAYPASTQTFPGGSSTKTSAWIPFWVKERGAGINKVTFSKPRAITTMTIGVSLTGLITDAAAPKRRLFLAAVVGEPARLTWDASTATEYALKDPNDPSKGRAPNAIYFFDATDPGKLTQSLDSAFNEVSLQSNINVTSNPNLPYIGASFGKQVYLGKFKPPSAGGVIWPGDLFMFATKEVNNQTVFLDKGGNPTNTLDENTAQWSAAATFVDAPAPAAPKWTTRNLYTRIPGSGGTPEPGLTVFSDVGYSGAGAHTPPFQKIQPYVATAQALDSNRRIAVQFAAGGDTNAALDAAGRPKFTRNNMMGDIIDSSPNVIEYKWEDVASTVASIPALAAVNGNRFRLILVGTNQGWLHAFGEVTKVAQVEVPPGSGNFQEIVNGAVQELWAYLPTDFLSRIDYLTSANNPHRFMVDGTPVIYHLDLPPAGGGSGNGVVDVATERVIAIFGLRKGGRSYYALDIHNPFTPAMKWSLVPDESAVFPASRTVAGGPSQATVQGILSKMGYSTCTPALARVMFNGGLRDVAFFGGGFSLPEVETNYAGAKLGRSVLAVDVNTGEVIAARDLTAVSATIGPIVAGVVPFEFFLNSGMAQRAYFTDFYGGLWSWGSKQVSSGGAADPFNNYRIDTSDVARWTNDGSVGTTGGVRRVAQDGTGVSALYSTLPAPFRVGSFPGAAKVAAAAIPAAVGVVVESGDRNNPLSNATFATYVGNNPPSPALHRVTVYFDRQDSRAWNLDSASGPDTGITDSQLKNFSAQNSPTAPEITLGNSNFYLAPSSGNPYFGYYMNLPGPSNGYLPKGLTEPMVVAGSLFYSYFSPDSADPCLGGSGTTSTRKICDVIYPIFDDSRTTVSCKSSTVDTYVGVASAFAAYSTRGVIQAGAIAVNSPPPGTSATTPVINTVLGRAQERFPRPRVWRTVR